MQIEQRLQLTKQNSHSVCFIKDNPLFCKLYNESAYIFTKLLNRQLHVSVQQIKKLNNQTVLSAGFPIKSILKSFPNDRQQIGDLF